MGQDSRIKRIHRLQNNLAQKGMDAVLIILSRDIFYYTGTAQPCILVVTPGDYFLVVRRALDFVRQETFIEKERIRDGGGFKDVWQMLLDLGVKKGTLGLEQDIIPAALYLKIKSIFNTFETQDISPLIFSQRMKKDSEEIKAIQQACLIMDTGHKRTLARLRPGITELELAAEIEYAHRKAGHEGVLSMRHFDFYISRGPLSAGKNLFRVSGFANTVTGTGLSPAVPAGPSWSTINAGDLVIADIPTCYRGYHCDQTRTYFLGDPPHEVCDLFEKLRQISDHTMETIRPGVSCGRVFDAAASMAAQLGVSQCFLGRAPRKGNFVGHGIGLDANEPPILSQGSSVLLAKNMVLTVELHLTHPEHGVVKLEDMVIIKETGCEILSVTPRQLFLVWGQK